MSTDDHETGNTPEHDRPSQPDSTADSTAQADNTAEPDNTAGSTAQPDSTTGSTTGSPAQAGNTADRRRFLQSLGRVAMVGGLAASYGTCGALGGRFLYPAKDPDTAWQYVSDIARISSGGAIEFQAPDGAPINIARRADKGDVSDFVALSSVCPHLGCRVHWWPDVHRFVCPCHNGVFTPEGKAISGPPADAGQSLARYPLRVDSGLLYIEVPLVETAAVSQPRSRPTGAHDRTACIQGKPLSSSPSGTESGNRNGSDSGDEEWS